MDNKNNCCCDMPKPCRCPHKKSGIPDFYAQFAVQANPPSDTDLPFFVLFEKGEKIILNTGSEIRLPAGYLYLIDFIFSGTPEPDGYLQITPRINNTLRILYSCFAPANNAARNTSASGSFTTDAAAAEAAVLSFNLVYPETVRNIDISGVVSVTPLMQIR